MNLNDLSAEDLARIDSICLAFESKLREGDAPSIDNFVSDFRGDHAELLRQELLVIQHELDEALRPKPIRQPLPIAPDPVTPEEKFEHDSEIAEVPNAPSGGTPVEDLSDVDLEQIESDPTTNIKSEELEEVLAEKRTVAMLVDEVVEPIVAKETRSEVIEQEVIEQEVIEQEVIEQQYVAHEVASHIPAGSDIHLGETISSESAEETVASTEESSSGHEDTLAAAANQIPLMGGDATAPVAEIASPPPPSRVRDEVLAPLPQEGAMIGPYQIGSTIGKGGMGVVYAATDVRLNRRVAITILSIRGDNRAELTERFEREAKAVAALSHPNIVKLFDVGVDNDLPFAVMEYLDGESLVDRLQRAPLTPSETRRLGAQICDALAVAHRGGVIHRDLKPDNVMLIGRTGGVDRDFAFDDSLSSRVPGQDGTAKAFAEAATIIKLVDFGLSRVPREDFHKPAAGEDEQATRSGTILGTPGYMAPEQARGETATSAADIFSLGCILFEAFYGQPAIMGESIADRFASTLEGTPTPDPIRRRDDVALADLIDECLRKAPEDRPTSAADLATRLRSTGTPVDRVTERIELGYATGEMVRRRFLTATAGGLVGAVVGGLAAPNHTRELMGIQRLAVLSFQDASSDAESTVHARYVAPVADRKLQRGDKLAALLVNELSRIPSISVTPFRPMLASDISEFVDLGEQLNVDALVTGHYHTEMQGTSVFVHLSLSIVSARTGVDLWEKTIVSDAIDNLLEQTKFAEDVASAIGRGLTSSASAVKPLNVESFHCFVDGKLRADPDSVAGLETALKCLEDAKNVDVSYVEPHAGIALAAITLAAQSDPEKTAELILKARQEIAYLERLGGGMLTSVDGRLANAMVNWQTLHRYSQAEKEINELALIAPNHWQVQHQRGLLLLTLGRQQLARQALKQARLLYPMSAILKIDLARAEWFSGNVERAKNDANIVLQRVECPFAKGLLIDIHEHQQDFESAASVHADFPRPESRMAYFDERAKRLGAQPYGAFGTVLNDAILRLRSQGPMDDASLAELANLQSPMLPLLLAAHPAFSATQVLKRAQEMLPQELTGRT